MDLCRAVMNRFGVPVQDNVVYLPSMEAIGPRIRVGRNQARAHLANNRTPRRNPPRPPSGSSQPCDRTGSACPGSPPGRLNNAYNAGKITVSSQAQPFPRPTGTPQLLHGDGSPEGIVFAPQGSLYMRRDGTGANSLYVKTTGVTVNTGWLAFGSAVGGAGTEWDYAQVTASPANVTATTEATAVAQITGNSVTYDGTRVKIEISAPGTQYNGNNSSDPNSDFIGVLLRDTTVLGDFYLGRSTTVVDGTKVRGVGFAVKAEFFDTPPAGTHTYKVAAYVTSSANSTSWKIVAGPGGSGNDPAAFLRVTKA